MKIFLDANIIFSAVFAGSHIEALLQILCNRKIQLVTNEHAWQEARRNLLRKSPENVSRLEAIRRMMSFVAVSAEGVPIAIREKDYPIIASALACSCTHLLTGDRKDFGKFFDKKIGTVQVVSPRLLAELLKLPRK